VAAPYAGKAPAALTFTESDWRVLTNYWHPVALAADVGERSVTAILLDQPLVITRTPRGITVADAAGEPAYPVAEKLGMIWTCLSGNPANELPDIPEWDEADYQHVNPPVVEMAASAGRQVEGFLDVAHLPWIHHQTFADRSRPVVPSYEVETTATGLHMEYDSPVGSYLRQDGLQVNASGTARRVWDVYLPFAAKLKAFNSDGANPIVLNVASPVHARQIRLFTALLRNYDQDQPVQPYIDFNLRIFNEDREIVESQYPEDLPLNLQDEVHIRADRASILYRQELGRLGLGRNFTA